MRYASRLLPVGLLTLTALVACSDQLEAPTASLRTAPPLSSQGPLRDSEIDRSDTHFSAQVETSTEQSGGDALLSAGGAALAMAAEGAYIEGGYGTDGRFRFSVYFGATSLSGEIGSVRVVGNEMQTYDRAGTRTRTETFDAAMGVAGLPSGDLSGAYFTSTPPVCPAGAPECTTLAATLRADAAAQGESDERIVRIRPNASRLNTPAANDVIEQRFRRVRRATAGTANTAGTAEAWRLEEIRRTQHSRVGGRDRVITEVTRMSYRAWNRNDGKEQGRDSVRATRKAALERAPASPALAIGATAASAASGARSVIARPAAVSGDPELLGLICQQGTAEFDRIRPEVSKGYNIVYQHGFCSNASVFSSFDERLVRDVPTKRSRAFSLQSTARIDSQVTALRGRIATKTAVSHMLVGHSQGGLVARRLGQRYPDYVGGVITIGTPHLGSYLAATGPVAAAEMLLGALDPLCFSAELCEWADDILEDYASGLLLFGQDPTAPALQDLTPGSPFLQSLNSNYELFPRVSIEVNSGRNWALARMVGDSRSPQERLLRDGRPSGDARVTEMERLYASAMILQYLSAAAIFWSARHSAGTACDRAGYNTLWPACTGSSTWESLNTSWGQTLLLFLTFEISGRVGAVMRNVNNTWDELTTRGRDETDGLIHLASQVYPNVPGIYPPIHVNVIGEWADSHAGEAKSPGSILAMRQALAQITQRVTQ